MSDVNVQDETEQTPADDLRSSLATAYAEQETRQEAKPQAAPEASTADESDPAVDAGEGEANTGADGQTAAERARDAAGKFVKGDGKAADAKSATDKAPAKAAVDPAAADPASAALATGPAALEKWTSAQKEMFKRQPPEVQEFILGRHKALEADYFKKTREFAGFRKDYEPVEQIFAPHREVMRQKGLTPRSLIEAWTNVETRLTRGEGVDVIKGLIQGYNIDRAQLATALGLSARTAAVDPARQDEQGHQGENLPYTIDKNGEPIALPPMVLDKLRKLDAIEQRLDQVDQFNRSIVNEGRSAQERRMQNNLDSFRSATDENGNLKHPHYDEIEDDMATIANGMLARGQSVPPLDELYERAVYANPSTRQSLRAAERQEAETKRQDEARAKAAAARKAGSSVTGYPSAGQAPGSTHNANRSLREELLAAATEAA